MSCIRVKHTPLPSGITCATETLGSICARAIPEACGIRVRMWQECRANLGPKYLEIEPEIVWVLNGWTSNNVYSNTRWNVG